MWRKRNVAPPKGRTAFTVALFAAALLASGAEARQRSAGNDWHEGYSTIVIDGKTGSVLDSSRPDELRHPASLTKIMTLYMLFLEIDSGRLKLNSRIKISADAAAQPPSKLGLKAGDTIGVEDAIKAMVTRSANDIAVAVSEVIAGDEDSFSRMMTRKAHALGMKRTVFKNASGLPDPDQVTTARDMALLGLAIQDRFPKLYGYFATRSFLWRGTAIANHNRLLGRVDGVDGIKTGYTRASGYNLVSSVKRGDRHVVAVVLGGRTGGARDEAMRDLIAENLRHAHAGTRTAGRFGEAPPEVTAAIRRQPPAPGSGEPIQPMPVRVVAVGKSGELLADAAIRADRAGPMPVSALAANPAHPPLKITPATPVALAPNGKRVTFAAPPALAGERPTAFAQESPEIESAFAALPRTEFAPREPAPAAQPEPPAAAPVAAAAPSRAPVPIPTPPVEPAVVMQGPWMIQIGAFNREQEAIDRLAEARERAASALARVRPYTEKAVKGSTEFYRARFAGFDEAGAKRACEALQKNDFACFPTRN